MVHTGWHEQISRTFQGPEIQISRTNFLENNHVN